MTSAWESYCKSVGCHQDTSIQGEAAQQLAYRDRIPQLTSRLGSVLASIVAAAEATEGIFH